MSSVRTTGFQQLDETLGRLAAGLPEQAVRDALHRGGQLIAGEARRIVRVDTGKLRDRIDVVDGRDVQIVGGVTAADMSVYVGPVGSTDDGDVFYAHAVEFEIEPYMRPATAAKRDDAERLVAREIAVLIKRAVG